MPYAYNSSAAYPVATSVGYRHIGIPATMQDPGGGLYSSMAQHRGQQRPDESEYFLPTAPHSHGRSRRGGGERERSGDRDVAQFRDRDSSQQQPPPQRRGQEYSPSAYPLQYQQQQHHQQQQQIYRSAVGNPNPQQQRLFNPNSGDRYGRNDDNYRDNYM